MNFTNLKEKIRMNKRLKSFVHYLIINSRRTAPRWWIKYINIIFFKRAKGSLVKRSAILNVSPINRFELGINSIIEDFCILDNGVGDICIGNNTRIGLRNTLIGPIYIGNNVILAQNIVLSGLNHNYKDVNIPIRKQGITKKQIIIEDDVWIGANSTITAGCTIGKHSVVAAGSVVTKDIPAFSICIGVPARIIKKFDSNTQEWISL